MNEKDQEKIDAITESMREIFDATQKTMMMDANLQLIKGVDDPSSWQKYQKEQLNGFKASLAKKVVAVEDDLRTVIKRAADLAHIKPDKIIDKNSKAMRALVYATENYVGQSIKHIHVVEKTMPLYDAILAQTQVGIEKGAPIYSRGRKYGFKEYMEMAVRTTLQTEISEKLLKTGGSAKIVFYLCNVYGDCAHDHKDYQGKIYYDERWETFGYKPETGARIKEIIRKRDMVSVQSVRDHKPWLTTRPNCRHNLMPITIMQAGGDVESTLKSLKMVKGLYRDDKYDKTQEQRKNERNIRFYKYRQEQNELLYRAAPSSQLSLMIAQDKMLVNRWQGIQRKLISENPFLERDYRRETRNIILQDLGVKYNLKPIPKPEPPKTPPSLAKFKEYEKEFYKNNSISLTKEEAVILSKGMRKTIDENDFAMRVPDYVFENNIMVDKRFKNQIEANSSRGYFDPEFRINVSRGFFGNDLSQTKAEEFEKYGYLAEKDNSDDAKDWGALHYGNVIIRFDKEKLKNRTTFTIGDSLMHFSETHGPEFLPSQTEDINLNVFKASGVSYSTYAFEHSKDFLTLKNSLGVPYIELQYHGELTLKDVKSITYMNSGRDYITTDTYLELLDNGVEIFEIDNVNGQLKKAGKNNGFLNWSVVRSPR